jgi:hypothetical protein
MNVKYMIGLKCRKVSRPKTAQPKPFKNGEKFNTIKGVVINPNTGNPAFTFEECDDDYCVDTHGCILMDDNLHDHVDKLDTQRQRHIHKKRKLQI